MPTNDRPPTDLPPAPGPFTELGALTWMVERRYFLAADGTVWCREQGYGVHAVPRWLPVPPESYGLVVLEGRPLEDLIAEWGAEQPSTVRPARRGR